LDGAAGETVARVMPAIQQPGAKCLRNSPLRAWSVPGRPAPGGSSGFDKTFSRLPERT